MNRRSSLPGLFLLSAAGFGTGAQAAWVEYGRDDNMVQYYESAIRKKGAIATVRVLSDAKAPVEISQGVKFRSVVITAEFDCDKRIGRDLSYTFKSGAMGVGTNVPVKEVADRKWDEAPLSAESDASRYAIWKIACGVK